MRNLLRFLSRSLLVGALAAALVPAPAHADYGGQGPIKRWGALIAAEAAGAMSQETAAMEEAFHGHLSTNPHDHCVGGFYETTDVAHGYRNPDERMQQSAGHMVISGSPAPLIMDKHYPISTH